MNLNERIKRYLRSPREEVGYQVSKIVPDAILETSWKRQGEDITFKLGGFARANSRPELITRHDIETRAIQEVIGMEPFDTSLEVGCGWGRLSRTIASNSKEHNGIDINEDALKIARQYTPNVQFQRASATELPYRDNYFDLVVSWTVLQHIPPHKFNRAAKEIERVLNEEGVLLLCEATKNPNGASNHTWDREISFYESAFSSFELEEHGYISGFEQFTGLESPGNLMVFKR